MLKNSLQHFSMTEKARREWLEMYGRSFKKKLIFQLDAKESFWNFLEIFSKTNT